MAQPHSESYNLLVSLRSAHACLSTQADQGHSATSLHSVLHELLRLSSIPLIVPSLTSGFHSSYYLGLGWGIAETAWGIVQGWEQMSLYRDVMKRDDEAMGSSMITIKAEQGDEEGQGMEEEEELERKVEVLEKLRSRRGTLFHFRRSP
jgi:hypothetical protein